MNTTHHIEVKDNVKPVFNPLRKVPHVLKPKLNKELKQMDDLDILEPIEKPTDWVNGLVIVENPNGKLRICLDPRALNNAIKRKHLPLSTAKEMFSQMSRFLKLGAFSIYWQIKVDQESSRLLAFGTHLGSYRFKRLL